MRYNAGRAWTDASSTLSEILNEFQLLYRVSANFTLHYTVFRQVSSHLPHEANTEQLFSLAGNISDDNGKMDPYRLGIWVSIAANHRTYEPPIKDILARYMAKFSKGVHATDPHTHTRACTGSH